jgi:hypothetical protein
MIIIHEGSILIKEVIAKLLCPEKSMILRPFASGQFAGQDPFDEANPSGWSRRMDVNGLKRATLTGK